MLAYSGLAGSHARLPITSDVPSKEVLPVAKEAALKALEIDDALAEAHISLAGINLWLEWDWQGAEKECKRAIELNPNHAGAHGRYAHLLSNLGRHSEALAEAKRALELDPVSPTRNLFLGQFLYQARQYDQAIEPLQDGLEIAPNDWVLILTSERFMCSKRSMPRPYTGFKKRENFRGVLQSR